MKKILALVLILSLMLSLCGCGGKKESAFRTLDVVGTKYYSTICRGGDKLAPVIEAAMSTLAGNGTLSALTVHWLGSDRCCLEGDAGALAALEELPEPRTLIFGVERDFCPIAYEENGVARGLCVDIAMAIGELLGWETRVQSIAPDEVAAQLSSGNVDCVLGFDSGLVSAEKYSVGGCFMESDILLAVRSESELKRVKHLKGLRVGTVNDPAVRNAIRSSEKITKHAEGATEYLSLPRCIEAMDNGWCAAVVLDSLMLQYYQLGTAQ